MEGHLLNIAVILLGLGGHFVKTLMELRRGGDSVGFVEYFRLYPLQSASTLIGVAVAYVLMAEAGQATVVSSLLLGYSANSASDLIGGRTRKVLI